VKPRFSCLRVVCQAVLLWGFSFASLSLQAADHPAFRPVKELFSAMSKHDGSAMRAVSTDDFQLLEHGEDWSMQKLIDAVQPKGKPYERRNFFCQIRAEQKGDMAWVSYWNKAEIVRDDSLRTVVWLESAVSVRKNGEWKVQMLHSTRVEPGRLPSDIEWVRFGDVAQNRIQKVEPHVTDPDAP